MISLWNYTASPEDLQLTLYYRGGQYTVPIHIEPRADYELDLASLVHSQMPDVTGAVIPNSITEGSALLTDAKGEGNKINVASSIAEFNVRNATCSNTCVTCNGVSQASLTSSTLTLSVGGTAQENVKITYNTGQVYYTTAGNWSSSSSAASVTQGGLVAGVSGGTSTIVDSVSNEPAGAGYICNPSGSCPAPITIQPSAQATVR